jgi:iron-sulfur cluster repair protein YtfE (RIC family)
MARRRILVLILAAAGFAASTFARRARRARAQERPADVGFMYAMHAAFRRDLSRLQSAAQRSEHVPPKVREGWGVFRYQLETHHAAEDDDLWPLLRRHTADTAALAEIDAMVREHAQIPDALDRIERAFDSDDDVLPAVNSLSALVRDHLAHEERTVLPLVERNLTDAQWHGFLETERRKSPPRERPTFLAWVLDDADPQDVDAVLRELPPPGRVVFRNFIQPRYAARHLWSYDDLRTRDPLVLAGR